MPSASAAIAAGSYQTCSLNPSTCSCPCSSPECSSPSESSCAAPPVQLVENSAAVITGAVEPLASISASTNAS